MGRSLQGGSDSQSLIASNIEQFLSTRDCILGGIIASQTICWPTNPTEDPIWGLLRIVMAQQVSTAVACSLAKRVKNAYPDLAAGSRDNLPDNAALRAFGLPERRAQCCVEIVRRSEEILDRIQQGELWEQALAGIKGIGPWTVSVFRIMVLRHPDVLPLGDIGLQRAIANVYGRPRNVERLGKKWKPFRSVACWYLWRTLGNEQLG